MFLAGKALDIDVGFTAILAFFPACAIVQTLPVTIGGLGVREGALYVFLHPLGVTTEQAISLGVLVYAMHADRESDRRARVRCRGRRVKSPQRHDGDRNHHHRGQLDRRRGCTGGAS